MISFRRRRATPHREMGCGNVPIGTKSLDLLGDQREAPGDYLFQLSLSLALPFL